MHRRLQHLTAILAIGCAILLVGCGGENAPNPATPTSAPTGRRVPPTPTRTPIPLEQAVLTPIPTPTTHSALVDIRQRGEVRVGVLYNYPPLGYMADNGQLHGYEVELMRRIAERWGVEVTFVQVTRQTRLPMLLDGEVDILAAAVPHRRELEQFVVFTETTFRGGFVMLVRADTALDLTAVLASGAIAVLDDEAQEATLQRAHQAGLEPTIQLYDTLDKAVEALKAGTVNGVVGRRERLMVAAQPDSGVEILEEYVLAEPYAFAVRRGDIPLRDLLNLTLYDLIRAGEIGEIFSASFYGLPADLFPTPTGEPAYDFASLPAEIPTYTPILERLRRGEPLRVAGLDLSEQPALYDSQPIIDGFNRAVINEMARRWNVSVTEIPASAGQAGLDLLPQGQADLVVGVRPDIGYIGQLAFSQPYYDRALRLIHLQDVAVANVLDLEFKPTAVVNPVDLSQQIVEDNNDFPRIQIAASYEEAFEALTSRAVYAVVGDEYALTLMARADPRIVIDERRYRPREMVMALPRFDADFQALVNFTLQDMQRDGTLEALRQQYFAPYLPEGQTLEAFHMEIWPGNGGFLTFGG